MIDRLYRVALRCAYCFILVSRRFRNPRIRGAYIAVWSAGRLLLIRNSYRPGETLPAGGLKRGETHRQAARRELAEEVGIEVSEDRLEFVCEIEVQGRYGRDCAHFFELRFEHDPDVRIDRREVVWWEFCPAEELPDRPLIAMVRSYLTKRRESPGPAQ